MKKIRVGTRGSKLALWQAQFVADTLIASGFQAEIVTIETKGDKILDQPFAEIGTKGIFTEEIESRLLNNSIEIAVHSAKDLQSELPKGLEIIAFMKREEPNDVLVSYNPSFTLTDTKEKIIVGTSSARRKAMMGHYYPGVSIVEARGNLQTRFKKMQNGDFHAMILAYAGVHRMGYDHFIVEKLPVNIFIPAVAQGSIAIEIASHLEPEVKEAIRNCLNDDGTEACLRAERSYLRTLEGGCSIPIFALATLVDSNTIVLTGGIASTNGAQVIRRRVEGSINNPVDLGLKLASEVAASGGDHILTEIRITQQNSNHTK